MNVLELSEQEIGRRESLQELRQMGINPYPAAEYPTNAFPPTSATRSATRTSLVRSVLQAV